MQNQVYFITTSRRSQNLCLKSLFRALISSIWSTTMEFSTMDSHFKCWTIIQTQGFGSQTRWKMMSLWISIPLKWALITETKQINWTWVKFLSKIFFSNLILLGIWTSKTFKCLHFSRVSSWIKILLNQETKKWDRTLQKIVTPNRG